MRVASVSIHGNGVGQEMQGSGQLWTQTAQDVELKSITSYVTTNVNISPTQS